MHLGPQSLSSLAEAVTSRTSATRLEPSVQDDILRQNETEYNATLQEILQDIQMLDSADEQSITRLLQLLNQNQPRKFQIVGDNIDMIIKTKQMSREKQNTDIHWFLMYAIMDEIVDSSLSEDSPVRKISEIKPTDCLPSAADKEKLHDIFAVLWSRIIVKTIPAFKPFEKSVIWHIPHKYTEEMKNKSETVSVS